MKERPILFRGELVRAILDGRKTQTRRPVKPGWIPIVEECLRLNGKWVFSTMEYDLTTPFGEPGDRLWVRETWADICHSGDAECHCEDRVPFHRVEYRADTGNPRPGDWPEPTKHEFQDAPPWRPSIHMPRWASRITLEITGVRIERIQEISEADCWREGIERSSESPSQASTVFSDYASPRRAFNLLWDGTYAPNRRGECPGGGSFCWAANPWVWVIEYRRAS
jgi:hypothetical protein